MFVHTLYKCACAQPRRFSAKLERPPTSNRRAYTYVHDCFVCVCVCTPAYRYTNVLILLFTLSPHIHTHTLSISLLRARTHTHTGRLTIPTQTPSHPPKWDPLVIFLATLFSSYPFIICLLPQSCAFPSILLQFCCDGIFWRPSSAFQPFVWRAPCGHMPSCMCFVCCKFCPPIH